MSLTRFVAVFALALLLGPVAAEAVPTVTNSNLNLRTGPSLQYPVAFVIPAGSPVNVVSCGATWCIVTWAGQTGYCDGNYLMQTVTIPVTVARSSILP